MSTGLGLYGTEGDEMAVVYLLYSNAPVVFTCPCCLVQQH